MKRGRFQFGRRRSVSCTLRGVARRRPLPIMGQPAGRARMLDPRTVSAVCSTRQGSQLRQPARRALIPAYTVDMHFALLAHSSHLCCLGRVSNVSRHNPRLQHAFRIIVYSAADAICWRLSYRICRQCGCIQHHRTRHHSSQLSQAPQWASGMPCLPEEQHTESISRAAAQLFSCSAAQPYTTVVMVMHLLVHAFYAHAKSGFT